MVGCKEVFLRSRLASKLGMGAALATALLLPLAAFAHAHPTKMNPAPDSTVAPPAKLEITFSEAVEPKFSSLEVDDSLGMSMTQAKAQPVPGDAMTLMLPLPKLAAGVYTVKWVSVATDGHRLANQYKFTVQ